MTTAVVPICAQMMGCLCAGHARGNDPASACDTSETPSPVRLRCSMTTACTQRVSHIDNSGFIYCADHGVQRRTWKPCRKMTPSEIKRIAAGGTISYARKSK